MFIVTCSLHCPSWNHVVIFPHGCRWKFALDGGTLAPENMAGSRKHVKVVCISTCYLYPWNYCSDSSMHFKMPLVSDELESCTWLLEQLSWIFPARLSSHQHWSWAGACGWGHRGGRHRGRAAALWKCLAFRQWRLLVDESSWWQCIPSTFSLATTWLSLIVSPELCAW